MSTNRQNHGVILPFWLFPLTGLHPQCVFHAPPHVCLTVALMRISLTYMQSAFEIRHSVRGTDKYLNRPINMRFPVIWPIIMRFLLVRIQKQEEKKSQSG